MMKLLHVLLLLVSLSLFAQDKPEATVTREDHSKDANGIPATGMDKDYYQFYFETLPDGKATEKTKLEVNLVRSLKQEILRKDKHTSEEYLATLKPEAITYAIITPESIWVRGIKDAIKYVKFTEFMYIVKFDKYQLYVSFQMDPKKYLQDAFQAELLYKKENIFLANPATR